MELADPGITTEPREFTASQSRLAGIFTICCSPKNASAALDVCVASSIAAAARGDAAQAAFDRKLPHFRNEIGTIEATEHLNTNRSPSAAVDPAVTRTLQYAADIASSQNRREMSAKSLHRRWFCMKSKSLEQPRPARSCRIPQREQSGSSQASLTELCTTGNTSLLSTAGQATTTSTTLKLTQQYQTTAMTLSPCASYAYESV